MKGEVSLGLAGRWRPRRKHLPELPPRKIQDLQGRAPFTCYYACQSLPTGGIPTCNSRHEELWNYRGPGRSPPIISTLLQSASRSLRGQGGVSGNGCNGVVVKGLLLISWSHLDSPCRVRGSCSGASRSHSVEMRRVCNPKRRILRASAGRQFQCRRLFIPCRG